MKPTNTIDADRVTSLFISVPVSSCPDCYEETCSCPKITRTRNKTKIAAELKLLREKRRIEALQKLQLAFKEDALCRFN